MKKQIEKYNWSMGFMIKQLLKKLSDTVAPKLISRFCNDECDLYTTAVTCIIKNFPLGHQVLKHAKFVTYEARFQGDVSPAEFFINNYQTFLEIFNLDYLHEEFIA